jgi:mannobiose 2-epimerase
VKLTLFDILNICAYLESTIIIGLVMKLFRSIENHPFDKSRNGYTDVLSRDWGPIENLRLSEKDQNESKTMNTYLHILEAYTNLYRVWKDPELEKALGNNISLFLNKFIDRERKHLNLFFDDDWVQKSNLVSYGHDIECAWIDDIKNNH